METDPQLLERKTKADGKFKEGTYSEALKLYKEIFEEIYNTNNEDLCYRLCANIAQCNLSLKQYDYCIEWCNEAFKLSTGLEEKLFYRRGKAYMHLEDYKSAQKDFDHVLTYNQNNQESRKQLQICAKGLNTQKDNFHKEVQIRKEQKPWTENSIVYIDQWDLYQMITTTVDLVTKCFDVESIDYTISTEFPTWRYEFLPEGLSVLLEQVFSRNHTLYDVLYQSLRFFNYGAFSRADVYLTEKNKQFKYSDGVHPSNSGSISHELFNVIMLRNFYFEEKALKILDTINFQNCTLYEKTLYCIEYFMCLRQDDDYARNSHWDDKKHLEQILSNESNRLPNQTILFVHTLIAEHISKKFHYSGHYLEDIKQNIPAKLAEEALQYLSREIKDLGNIMYNSNFWLLIAKLCRSANYYRHINKCHRVIRYSLFHFENVIDVCEYYTELIILNTFKLEDYDSFFKITYEFQQWLYQQVIINDNSTSRGMIKFYSSVISRAIETSESAFICHDTLGSESQKPDPYLNLRKKAKWYATHWFDFRITNAWKIETLIGERITRLMIKYSEVQDKCAYITFISYRVSILSDIWCVVLTTHDKDVKPMNLKMSIEDLWRELDGVVEEVSDSNISFQYTHRKGNYFGIDQKIYSKFIKPIEDILRKRKVEQIKIVTKKDFDSEVFGRKLSSEGGTKLKLPDNCCYVMYSRCNAMYNLLVTYVVFADKKTIVRQTSMVYQDVLDSVRETRENDSHITVTTKNDRSNNNKNTVRATLYDIFIRPIWKDLKDANIKKIKIIAEEFFHFVPFSTLFDEVEKLYLCEQVDVSFALSLEIDQLHQLSKSPTPIECQLMMCTTTRIDEQNEEHYNLPKALDYPLAEELAQCRKQNIPGNFNEQITRTQLLEYFKTCTQPGIFHYGGHAEWTENINYNDYTLTGCFILEKEHNRSAEETVIHASEICAMNLSHLQLVVLNTCSSLRSKDANRGGPLGLARAFLVAGVPCVIATHTTVRDEANIFASHFYKHLHKRETIASSFKKALLATMGCEKYTNPEKWGSFILLGNDDARFELMTPDEQKVNIQQNTNETATS